MSELVNVVIPPLRDSYTYDIPTELTEQVQVGSLVEIPLGNRFATGYVVERITRHEFEQRSDTSFKLKPISSARLDYPCFDPTQLKFFRWVAEYYGSSLANVIDVAVPPAAPRKYRKNVILKQEETDSLRGQRQRDLVRALRESGGQIDYHHLLKLFKGAAASLKGLEKRGIIEIESNEILDQHVFGESAPQWAKSSVELNDEQSVACRDIVDTALSGEFRTFLLHGVTGSGKTEVYLEAIQKIQEKQLGALVVVPEIALTPQLVDRFRARLGNEIAVLHSGLSKRARWDAWRALLERRQFVAVGARSAIFAPVYRLGLIIVDEEHDTSFKQSEGLRYNARDLAIVRGSQDGCPVVLGSATPSLESFYAARTDKYTYQSLPSRHSSGSSVEIRLVDLNQVKPWEMLTRNVSPQLHESISRALSRDEQIFILYNRRGFASYLHCEACEQVVECPNCSVTLTYHQAKNSLCCHYCSLQLVPPEYCSNCSEAAGEQAPPRLTPRGAGTEKIFEELQELFPDTEIDRLDRDTAHSAREYRSILDRVRSGVSRILVGTQMIAKGHDLPGVTLVGVIDCDVGLHMPDFRAGERVFQLLTQVAGRAGRGENPGRVILQTRVPSNLSLQKTLSQDYTGFASTELKNRHALAYPPFARILRIVASSQEKALPAQYLRALRENADLLIDAGGVSATVLGPAPAPLEKLKTQWRWHLLIKAEKAALLNWLLRCLREVPLPSNRLKVIFDLDPQEML